ncbi:rhodanese-like domain-containing protein [Terriglobus tenax]|uniref:rhodanese-like domain-containing protein n=1 Tax=Terriglobus tenax TaxID=1111115 RepID=UPI0021DFC53E|nr:rhodanese-like domain-containing protein [Terriglobus tenax]
MDRTTGNASKTSTRRSFLWLLSAIAIARPKLVHAQTPNKIPASIVPQDHLLQPEALQQQLTALKGVPILQVGSHTQYDQAHIPGSEYIGLVSQPAGQDALRTRVKDLPRDKALVLYCGCCPWERCPNIGAAWTLLEQMGFRNVKVLYIANNFGADWVQKHYPVEPAQ